MTPNLPVESSVCGQTQGILRAECGRGVRICRIELLGEPYPTTPDRGLIQNTDLSLVNSEPASLKKEQKLAEMYSMYDFRNTSPTTHPSLCTRVEFYTAQETNNGILQYRILQTTSPL